MNLDKALKKLIYEFTDNMSSEEREEFTLLMERMINVPPPPRFFECENCTSPVEVSEDNLMANGDELQADCLTCGARHNVNINDFIKDGQWNFKMKRS